MSAIVGVYNALELYFGQPLARQWTKLPNRGPAFYGARPINAMIAGGLLNVHLVVLTRCAV